MIGMVISVIKTLHTVNCIYSFNQGHIVIISLAISPRKLYGTRTTTYLHLPQLTTYYICIFWHVSYSQVFIVQFNYARHLFIDTILYNACKGTWRRCFNKILDIESLLFKRISSQLVNGRQCQTSREILTQHPKYYLLFITLSNNHVNYKLKILLYQCVWKKYPVKYKLKLYRQKTKW